MCGDSELCIQFNLQFTLQIIMKVTHSVTTEKTIFSCEKMCASLYAVNCTFDELEDFKYTILGQKAIFVLQAIYETALNVQ